jgi:hypothetical protein
MLNICQGGGAATQLPAEQYHSGSNPDLGFLNLSKLKEFLYLNILLQAWIISWVRARSVIA